MFKRHCFGIQSNVSLEAHSLPSFTTPKDTFDGAQRAGSRVEGACLRHSPSITHKGHFSRAKFALCTRAAQTLLSTRLRKSFFFVNLSGGSDGVMSIVFLNFFFGEIFETLIF